jgi:hypothetical protein
MVFVKTSKGSVGVFTLVNQGRNASVMPIYVTNDATFPLESILLNAL